MAAASLPPGLVPTDTFTDFKQLCEGDRALYGFDKDGKFFLGEGVDAGDAAKVFWQNVRHCAERDREAAVLAEREAICRFLEKESSDEWSRGGRDHDVEFEDPKNTATRIRGGEHLQEG